jgi:RNA polymerase sigma factor (TIGR02999 family)
MTDFRPADVQGEVTRLLHALREGDDSAPEPVEDALFRHVYDELHRIARRHRARWSGNDTLNTTALVHEAYLKLVGGDGDYAGRAHFLAVAAKAMRHILITYAERQTAQKRGGGQRDLPLDEALLVPEDRVEEVAALGEALAQLEAVDERAARVVECRFFAGLDAEETAEALGVSRRTVTRDWAAARAWLYDQLRRDLPPSPL